jgi:hypothetical protein
MGWLSDMSDEEFAAWLRTVPRERSPEQVARAERAHDVECGEYVNRHASVHHYGESRH